MEAANETRIKYVHSCTSARLSNTFSEIPALALPSSGIHSLIGAWFHSSHIVTQRPIHLW